MKGKKYTEKEVYGRQHDEKNQQFYTKEKMIYCKQLVVRKIGGKK